MNFGLSFLGLFSVLAVLGGVILTPIFLILWITVQSEQAKKVFKILTIISALLIPFAIVSMGMIFFGYATVNKDLVQEEMSYEEFLDEYSDEDREEEEEIDKDLQ